MHLLKIPQLYQYIRGTSKKPLYITAGIELQKAVENIQSMLGEHRIPTILKIVDSLSKSSKV